MKNIFLVQNFYKKNILQKHDRGSHNQQSHANRYGSAKESADFNTLSTEEKVKKLYTQQEEWQKSVSEDESFSFGDFINPDTNFPLNEQLRKGTPLKKGDQWILSEMKQAISRYEIPEAISVHRGFRDTKEDDFWNRFQQVEKTGELFSDKAIISTTVDPEVAESFAKSIGDDSGIHIIVHLPKGTHTALVDPFDNDTMPYPLKEMQLYPFWGDGQNSFSVTKTAVLSGRKTVEMAYVLKA